MILTLVAIIDFFLNIPFGYWRNKEKKFSLGWFLSIHIPIPFIIILRHYSGIGFALYTYPIMVASFFLGQFTGKYISKKLHEKGYNVSKSIFTDLRTINRN